MQMTASSMTTPTKLETTITTIFSVSGLFVTSGFGVAAAALVLGFVECVDSIFTFNVELAGRFKSVVVIVLCFVFCLGELVVGRSVQG